MDHISCYIGVCAASFRGEDTHGAVVAARQDTKPINRQATMSSITGTHKPLDESAIDELEIIISIPLDSLLLKVLELKKYSDLLNLLP